MLIGGGNIPETESVNIKKIANISSFNNYNHAKENEFTIAYQSRNAVVERTKKRYKTFRCMIIFAVKFNGLG